MRILERDGQSSSPSFRIFWNEIEHDFSGQERRVHSFLPPHGAVTESRTTRRSTLLEGAALPCSRPARCALRAICDALPRHRPAAWLSAPWMPTRSAALSDGGGQAWPARVGRHGGRPSKATGRGAEAPIETLGCRGDEISQRDLTDFFFPAA